MAKYAIRFFFDWGADCCLWSGNDAAEKQLGCGIIGYDKLNISEQLKADLEKMAHEFQTALNWDYPPDPSPWSIEQKDDFMCRSKMAFDKLTKELGENYEVEFLVKLPE